jgi:hypothetical protein
MSPGKNDRGDTAIGLAEVEILQAFRFDPADLIMIMTPDIPG